MAWARDSFPDRADEMLDFTVEHIFPNLTMDRWVQTMVESIPEGKVTTFGNIARALGDIKASRAVGSVIASGRIRGPIHRVVYSDGKIPTGSERLLRTEIGEKEPQDMMVGFDLEDPPLASLGSIQIKTSRMVVLKWKRDVRSLMGADISSKKDLHVAAGSVHDLGEGSTNSITTRGIMMFPYVSGYLFFREGPLLIKLISEADGSGMIDDDTMIVLDGNGTLHPKRMGIATHLGAVLDRPTCGVCKRLMTGSVGKYAPFKNGIRFADVRDENDRIGLSVEKDGKRPFYLSPGHLCDARGLLDLISPMINFRIPDPTRRAHILANNRRREIEGGITDQDG